jgi:hypothetical protein
LVSAFPPKDSQSACTPLLLGWTQCSLVAPRHRKVFWLGIESLPWSTSAPLTLSTSQIYIKLKLQTQVQDKSPIMCTPQPKWIENLCKEIPALAPWALGSSAGCPLPRRSGTEVTKGQLSPPARFGVLAKPKVEKAPARARKSGWFLVWFLKQVSSL